MINVLLVDDHALFRSSVRLRLEQEDGIEPVGEAASAEQAIGRARSLEPDLVLIDLLLPRTSGYDAIPEILAVSPATRVLVVSSQTAPSSVRQAISAGAHGFVPKRASDTELIEAIRRIAAGERYVDPDLGAQLVVADGTPALDPISERERDVLHLLALGHTNQ
jgi:DNA-binding NarL/FixJ family response regulator